MMGLLTATYLICFYFLVTVTIGQSRTLRLVIQNDKGLLFYSFCVGEVSIHKSKLIFSKLIKAVILF